MPRQKNVYSTNRIAHLWAHKTQNAARNSQGNFYFSGDTIYSYGSHFPIARHITHKGKPAILFTTRGYGPTTSKHISLVRRAIPTAIPVFYVGVVKSTRFDHGNTYTLKDCFDWHKGQVKSARKTLDNATRKPSRVKAFEELRQRIVAANEFCEFFGFRTRFKGPQGADGQALVALTDEYNAQLAERAKAREANRSDRQRRMDEQRDLQRQQMMEAIAEVLPRLCERWREGESLYTIARDLPDNVKHYWNVRELFPTMIRIVGGNASNADLPAMVETSLGADFPIEHALRAMPIVERILDRGEEWHTNGHSIHLGHYQIDRIDADGTLHAGCHHITRDELVRFIGTLKAYAEAVTR